MASTGATLKQLREQRDMSMQELADKVGVHKGTIFKWEHDQVPLRKASKENLENLALALHVPIDELITTGTKDLPGSGTILIESDGPLNRAAFAAHLSTYQRLLSKQKDRIMRQTVDMLAAQNGMSIDYTEEGDIMITNSDGSQKQTTEAELLEAMKRINDFAVFTLGQLGR